MKKLNIAVVMQSPDIGGAEIYMDSLIREFKKSGNKIYLVTNEGRFYESSKNLEIPQFRQPFVLDISGNLRGLIKTILLTPFALLFYSKMLFYFKQEKIDLILMSSFTEKLFVSFLSLFFRVPVFWIEYGPLKPVFKRNFYIPKIAYVLLTLVPKKIIVPTNNTFRSLRKDAYARDSKLIIIPCGIDVNQKAADVPQNLKEKFMVGSMSRLTREKGQDYLIKSIPKVLKEIPNAYFIIAGDGPDRQYFENLVKELGVYKNVRMPGFVEDRNYYYSAFDIFVFPTVWDLEGFGLVAIEAMIHKLPVVGSNLGPVPEIIDNDINGILVKPKDEEELAKAIIKLGLNDDLRKKMGNNGYKKALAIYNIEKVGKKILNVFYESTK